MRSRPLLQLRAVHGRKRATASHRRHERSELPPGCTSPLPRLTPGLPRPEPASERRQSVCPASSLRCASVRATGQPLPCGGAPAPWPHVTRHGGALWHVPCCACAPMACGHRTGPGSGCAYASPILPGSLRLRRAGRPAALRPARPPPVRGTRAASPPRAGCARTKSNSNDKSNSNGNSNGKDKSPPMKWGRGIGQAWRA